MAGELRFIGQIAPDPSVGEEIVAQARSVLSRLTLALTDRGLALEDLLRLRLFVRDLDELPKIEAALDARVGSRRPALSIVELPGDPAEPGVALTLDAVAAPGAGEQRRLLPHSARLGPWVFLGAVTAPDPRRELPRERRILLESRALFAHVEELLHEQGAKLCDIVKVGGWLTFPMRDYGQLGETRSALVGEAGLLPASAAVQVARVGREGELLAFEAIAYAPEDRGGHADSESPSEHGADDERADAGRPTAETTSRLADF